jgi:cytochrome c-type biogenesis protein CcmH
MSRRTPTTGFAQAGLAMMLLSIVLAFIVAAHAAIDPLPFDSEAERLRFHALTSELRCVMCQNQSLADSNALIAHDLRREVYELMRGGKSDAAIKSYLTERYGDFVLYRPPLDRRTWWLWFGPGLIAIVGLVATVMAVRRRRRIASGENLRPVETDEW